MTSTVDRDDGWLGHDDILDVLGPAAPRTPRPVAATPTHEGAESAAHDQVARARAELARPVSDYLRLPWASVADLVGGIAPGTLGVLMGYSGNGKSTFLMNLTDMLLQEDRCVYYMGLESSPDIIRTQLACLRLNLHPGDVLSGKLKSDRDWPLYLTAISGELDKQAWQLEHNRLLVGDQPYVDITGLAAAAADAEAAGADLLIVDHIDHVGGGGDYKESVQAVHWALSLALKHRLRVLVASQLNNSATLGDRLAQYRRPAPSAMKMGTHKREVAHYVLSVWRPLKPNVTKEELQAVKGDQLDIARILAPHTMAVGIDKDRNYGREGRKALLHVSEGRVRERTSMDDVTERIHAREEVPF